jgi:hypothetical protein
MAANALGDVSMSQVAAIRDLTGPARIIYVWCKNARLDSSTLGDANASLTPVEARAMAYKLAGDLPIPVRVVPAAIIDATTFRFDAPDAGFPTNTDLNYVGQMFEISSSVFNATPDLSFQIAVAPLGGPAALGMTMTFRRLGGTDGMEFTILMGTIVSGVLQFAPAMFRVGGVPSPQYRWTITGLPTATHFVNARYVIRGESRIGELLSLAG